MIDTPTLGDIRIHVTCNKKSWHKQIWAACLDCGKARWVGLVHCVPERLRCKSCSKKHWYTEHPHPRGAWKGGRTLTGGYIRVQVPKDSPYRSMANTAGYVSEHRLVYAQFLGRPLRLSEIIHHKNRSKIDNRLENLQLVTNDEHRSITYLEERITRLEKRNDELEKQIRLLKFQFITYHAEVAGGALS